MSAMPGAFIFRKQFTKGTKKNTSSTNEKRVSEVISPNGSSDSHSANLVCAASGSSLCLL